LNNITGKNQETPLITVLTLSYYSPDLYAAVNSVLEQDYKRIQYILADDGTESFSENIISEYIGSRRGLNIEEYIIIKNPENYGTVRAANIGLRHAKGEYIFILAGDDMFAGPSVIREWAAAFKQGGALFMTAYRDIYDEKMEQYLGRMPTAKQARIIRGLTPRKLFEKIAGVNIISGCCTAYSRRCFEQYGYFDEKYKLIEDDSMILRLLRQGASLGFFEKSVVRYRSNGHSSPAKYNEDYERDVDLIFKYEILPHTKNPKRKERLYKNWKKRRRMARELHIKIQRAGNSPLHIFIFKLWFYINFPIASVRGLAANPVKIKKMFKDI
jgi:GT2 family glycosyltransferase